MNSQLKTKHDDAGGEVAVVAELIENARIAMATYEKADQARVDEAVTALAWSIYKPDRATELAEFAVAAICERFNFHFQCGRLPLQLSFGVVDLTGRLPGEFICFYN